MPDIDLRDAMKELDRWARGQGYASFDVYISAGGGFGAARADIEHKRHRLHLAMVALYRWKPPQPPERAAPQAEKVGAAELEDYERANARMATGAFGPEALARAEAEVIGDPVDPDNAGIQGTE